MTLAQLTEVRTRAERARRWLDSHVLDGCQFAELHGYESLLLLVDSNVPDLLAEIETLQFERGELTDKLATIRNHFAAIALEGDEGDCPGAAAWVLRVIDGTGS